MPSPRQPNVSTEHKLIAGTGVGEDRLGLEISVIDDHDWHWQLISGARAISAGCCGEGLGPNK
jgi:hypothetical protein